MKKQRRPYKRKDPAKKLDRTVHVDELKNRWYTVREVAELNGVCYMTMYRRVQDGLIKSQRDARGWHKIPLDEVKRILGVDVEETLYLQYTGPKFPHSAYLYYLMIETLFDLTEIKSHLEKFRMVCPDQSILVSIWEALIRSAPKQVADAMRDRRAIYKKRGYKNWIRALGLEDLFNSIPYPCLGVLYDTSSRRVAIEVLMGGRVSLEEIRDFLHARHSAYYTIDQLRFFQQYFYNVMDFTTTDYFAFLSYITDSREVMLKRRGWDSPDLAKIQVGVPMRSDFETGIHEIAEQARMKAMEVAAMNHADPQSFRIYSDVYLKAFDRDLKAKARVEEEMAEAMQHAENKSKSAVIEEDPQDRVLYDDLIQDDFEDDKDEGLVKAG